jgi:glycosyltransferase involved in cell wall biosynthesis
LLNVLIIIPCYNEGQNIVPLLNELKSLNRADTHFTFLPINDCSKDNTLECLQQHATSFLNLPNNLGIGGAVQSGIKYAQRNGFDFAIQMDGDGQHPPSEVSKLIEATLNSNCDICLGSRYMKWEGFQSTAIRRFGIRFLNVLIGLTTGQKIFDSTSGYRLFNKKAIKLFSEYYPDKYPEPEVIVYGKLSGLKITEVPVFMRDREGGESSISGITSSVYYMIKVSLAIFFIKLNFMFAKKK